MNPLPSTDRYPLKEKGEEGAGDGGSPLSERRRGRSKHGLRGTGALAAPLLCSYLTRTIRLTRPLRVRNNEGGQGFHISTPS